MASQSRSISELQSWSRKACMFPIRFYHISHHSHQNLMLSKPTTFPSAVHFWLSGILSACVPSTIQVRTRCKPECPGSNVYSHVWMGRMTSRHDQSTAANRGTVPTILQPRTGKLETRKTSPSKHRKTSKSRIWQSTLSHGHPCLRDCPKSFASFGWQIP